MSEPHLKLKPYVIGALLPHYFYWVKVFTIVAVLVYFLMKYVGVYFFPHSSIALKIWLVPIVLIASFVMIKHRIIRYHMTTYYFHSNRFVYEYDLITKTRRTIPYQQVKRIEHSQKMWQRFFDIADLDLIVDNDSFRMHAIKSPEKTEHEIYSIMKMKPTLHRVKKMQEDIEKER